MFQIARELESASAGQVLPGFDILSSNAKSALGAFLDFGDLSREAFAKSWEKIARDNRTGGIDDQTSEGEPIAAPSNSPNVVITPVSPNTTQNDGPLFEDKNSK